MVFAMLLSLFGTVNAADVAVIKADKDVIILGRSQTVTIPIIVSGADALKNLGDGTIGGIEIVFAYDTDYIAFTGVKTDLVTVDPTGFSSDAPWQMDVKLYENDTAKVMIHDPKNVGVAAEGDVVFIQANFKLTENAIVGEEYEVGITLVDICDAKASPLASGTQVAPFKLALTESNSVFVIEKIAKLGEIADLSKKEAIVDARESYDALTEAEKAEVSNYDLLVAAEAKISEIERAALVDDMLEALDSVIYLSQKQSVIDARAAYDELTTAEKEYITQYDKLPAAEERMMILEQIPKGDIIGTGKADVAAVVALRVIIINEKPPTPEQLAACDFNEDNVFTVADVVSLRVYIMNS